MFHEGILYISYRKYINFWFVICIAKNFIWTTLNIYIIIFSNSCISAKYCPVLTNHTSMESLFILYKSQFKKLTLVTGFVVQGHK